MEEINGSLRQTHPNTTNFLSALVFWVVEDVVVVWWWLLVVGSSVVAVDCN